MKTLIAAAICSLSLLATPVLAQDKKDAPKKEPTAAQKKQQERMKDCNAKAGEKKMEGDERKKFMSACLKGQDKAGQDKGEKMGAQQSKMKTCNKEAGDKKLKGDDRKKYMSECLKS